MARKGLTGQLNMFDFFREWEAASPQAGEIEMVSLMPLEESEAIVEEVESVEEQEPIAEVVELVEEPEPIIEEVKPAYEPKPSTPQGTGDRPVMHRSYTTQQGIIEIAYINYSKVRISEPGKSPKITEFETSKEAVDYYVEQMQRLEELYDEE